MIQAFSSSNNGQWPRGQKNFLLAYIVGDRSWQAPETFGDKVTKMVNALHRICWRRFRTLLANRLTSQSAARLAPERTNRMLVTRGDNAELTRQPPGSLHCGFCRPQEPTHQRFWAGLFGARLWEVYRDHEHVEKQEWTLASSAQCLSNFQTSLNAFKKGTGAVMKAELLYCGYDFFCFKQGRT